MLVLQMKLSADLRRMHFRGTRGGYEEGES